MMLSLLLLLRPPPSETKFTELELELSGDSGRLGGGRGFTSFKISMAYSKALSWGGTVKPLECKKACKVATVP